MNSSIKQNQKGFTIVELGIATLVFSTVLLLITFGLIRVGRAFTKSVNVSKTQEVARTIVEDVSQSIQFSGDDVVGTSPGLTGPNGSQGFCIGNRRYSYVLDRRLGDPLPAGSPAAFVVDTEAACNGSTPSQDLQGSIVGTELLSPGMTVDAFSVEQVPGREGFWTVNVRVIFGDPAIDFTAPDAEGRRGCALAGGTEYCAVSDLTTTVQKRIE